MEEETSFHSLPPAKRFKLLQHQSSPSRLVPSNPSSLPLKKRSKPVKESFSATGSTACLPAKKRVWAPHPLFSEDEEPETHLPEKELSPPPPKLPDLNEVVVQDDEKPALEISVGSGEDEEGEGEKEEEEDGIVCCICKSTDGDPSDPIVLCDGCDLTVHAACYGEPLVRAVPDGDWFCHRCDILKEEKVIDTDCFLCPVKGGATKPAVDGRWAHISCSLLVPEVFFKDAEGREGIDCSKVPCRRWEGVCYICNTTDGCVIDCSEPKCPLAFHVGCGLEDDLCIEYKERKGGAVVAGFCKAHTELWVKQQQTGKFKIVAREQKRKKI